MIGWEKAKFFVIRHHTGLMVLGLALFLAVSYTHLTLPTKRIV